MDQKTKENLLEIDSFFDAIGFDSETKKDHIERLTKIIFASTAEKLDNATAMKEKAEMPAFNSVKDFYDYYQQYIDRAIIEKVIEEEAHRQFSEYFEAIKPELPQ